MDGKEIAVHDDEKKAYNYEKRKAFELAVEKKWGKSNLETLCSADEERFIIVESPEYNFGKYTTLAEIEQRALKHAQKLAPEARQKYIDMHVAKKTADLYKFLTSKTGTIRGIQRLENQIIDTLQERGLTFVNKGNIQKFGEYMEYLRAINKGRQFDSERAAELFGTAVKKGIDPMEIAEDFDFWNARADDLAKQPKIQNAKMRTAEEYKKLLNIERK